MLYESLAALRVLGASRSQHCTGARNRELGTVHRHLVALPLAWVQSDRRSGELEEPVLVQVDSAERSSSLFVVRLTPKEGAAGRLSATFQLAWICRTVSAKTAAEDFRAIILKRTQIIGGLNLVSKKCLGLIWPDSSFRVVRLPVNSPQSLESTQHPTSTYRSRSGQGFSPGCFVRSCSHSTSGTVGLRWRFLSGFQHPSR